VRRIFIAQHWCNAALLTPSFLPCISLKQHEITELSVEIEQIIEQ